MEPRPAARKELLSIADVAKRLGMPLSTAYDAARRGLFPVVRNGSRMFVPARAFENWLDGASLFATWPKNGNTGEYGPGVSTGSRKEGMPMTWE